MIITVVLANPSIMSHNYQLFPVMIKIKIWSLSNFEVYIVLGVFLVLFFFCCTGSSLQYMGSWLQYMRFSSCGALA